MYARAVRRASRDAVLANERAQMARDLHDTVIQRMFGFALTLQLIAEMMGPGAVGERLGSLASEMDDSIVELRSIVLGSEFEFAVEPGPGDTAVTWPIHLQG